MLSVHCRYDLERKLHYLAYSLRDSIENSSYFPATAIASNGKANYVRCGSVEVDAAMLTTRFPTSGQYQTLIQTYTLIIRYNHYTNTLIILYDNSKE